jgi:membrane protein
MKEVRRYLRAANLPFRTLWGRMRDQDLFLMASAIAFGILLTTMPVLIIFASIAGIILHASGVDVQHLPEILATVFPPQPFAEEIRGAILRVVSDVVDYRTSLGLVGFGALILTTSFLFDIIRTALHRIYRIRPRRRIILSFLFDVLFVFAALVLLVLSNIALWALDFAREYIVQRYHVDAAALAHLDQSIPSVVVILLTTAFFYILYGYLTDTRPPWPAAVASTLSATTLWLLSGVAFGLYLQSYTLIGTVYGPYAFLLVLLLWVYYSSLVFVFGGVVGEVFWERLRRKRGEAT